MRAWPLIPLVLAAAAPAGADPAGACSVTVLRAPDAVLEAIVAWVHAEPHCRTVLEVRAVPTENGIYLFAQSPDGRVHERVVPDAQTAGVLVASWAADDWVPAASAEGPAGGTAIVVGSEISPITGAAVVGPGTTAILIGPGGTIPTVAGVGVESAGMSVVPVVGAPGVGVDTVATSRAPARPTRWLTLGGMLMMGGSGGSGARAEVDLVARGSWMFSAGLAGLRTLDDVEGTGFVSYSEVRLLGTVARISDFGAWELRLALGAGVVHTMSSGQVMDYTQPKLGWINVGGTSTSPTGEASALLSRRLGDWALGAGPVVTWVAQRVVNGPYAGAFDRQVELLMFGGLRHRL